MLEEIITLAKIKFNGNVRVAIAASLYGEAVIFDCNNQVPAWAELEKINSLESQVNNLIAQDELQGEKMPVIDKKPETEKVEENQVSIATLPENTEAEKAEEVEEVQQPTEQTKFTEAELFEIVLSANKQNVTIGNAIVQKMYGEKGFDASGSFSGVVNVHKVAYVKGLITQLLKAQTPEKVEEVKTVVVEPEKVEEKPTEPATTEIKDESNAAEVVTAEVTTEAENKAGETAN